MRDRRAIVIVSSAEDQVCPAFSAHCGNLGIPVLQAVSQADVGLYVRLGDSSEVLLRLRQPSGAESLFQPDDLSGVWFRNLPAPPPNLDPDEARYVNAEFYASLIAFLHLIPVPCFGLPAVPSLVPSNWSEWHIRDWCRERGIDVRADAEVELPDTLPIREYLVPQSDGAYAGPGPGSPVASVPAADAQQGEASEILYYVLCGRRRQVLVDKRRALPSGAAEAAAISGDVIAQGLSFQTAVMSFCCEADGSVSLGGVSQYLPARFILSDPEWYFGAVLESLERV